MAEKLPELLEIAVGAVEGVDIDRAVVMDGGKGEGVSNALNQRVGGPYGTMEGLASVLGVDIQEVPAARRGVRRRTEARHQRSRLPSRCRRVRHGDPARGAGPSPVAVPC